jgi:dihydrodipicolinate synthase/N-acetylneuraminate lyase
VNQLTLVCRSATTFSRTGELDEEAMAATVQRFVDAQLGVYLASGASGEGHALSADELRRVYEIGVDVGKGKIIVSANQPEQLTPGATIEHARIAMAAGVDALNIYGPEGRHGFVPTEDEYIAYFDTVLGEIRYPVALAPNPTVGYAPRPEVIASLCAKYPQVVAVNLASQGDAYFVRLKDALTRPVDIYVPYPASLHTLGMGATGLLGAEANVIPRTFRKYLDQYAAADLRGLHETYAELRRFTTFASTWGSSSPRWIKLAFRAWRLPGWAGGTRPPFAQPDADSVERFRRGALQLNIPEIDELDRLAHGSPKG